VSTIALTILSDVDDPAEDFVEIAARDVKTPPRGTNVGVIVTRAGNDPWLSASGWGPQPASAQLPVAIASAPGSKPLLLQLPRAWTQHLYPYEPIKIACPALEFEGVVAWFYSGANMPVTRDVAPAPPISLPPRPTPEETSPVETKDEPIEERSEPPIVQPPIGGPIGGGETGGSITGGGPTGGHPPIVDPPPERRFSWALVVLALLIVAGAALLATRPWEQRNDVPDEPIPVVESTPEQDFNDAQTAEAAGNCSEAQRLMNSAAKKELGEANFKLGEAHDPSGDAQTRSVCLASDWNMEVALDHYAKACKAGHSLAPDRVARLAALIESAVAADDGGSFALQAKIAQQAIPAAKAACSLP